MNNNHCPGCDCCIDAEKHPVIVLGNERWHTSCAQAEAVKTLQKAQYPNHIKKKTMELYCAANEAMQILDSLGCLNEFQEYSTERLRKAIQNFSK